MSKSYIVVRAKEEEQPINIADIIKVAVGAFFGCWGLYVGYCTLWAVMG